MAVIVDRARQSGRPAIAVSGVAVAAALISAVGLGLSGLATVGSEGWIAAGYGSAAPTAKDNHPRQANLGTTIQTVSSPIISQAETTLVVGDEQDWLASRRIPTEKAVTKSAGGYALGDRIAFSLAGKDGSAAGIRTFEIVAIEALAGVPADAAGTGAAQHVLVARETAAAGKPAMLRLLLTTGDEARVPVKRAPVNKSL